MRAGQHAHAPYGGDYGSYDPYAGGYDPYAGNYDPYDGGYHEYAPEDDYAPVDYGGAASPFLPNLVISRDDVLVR